MNILEKLWFKFTHGGQTIEVLNNSNPVTEYCLHFKDAYIYVLEGDDGVESVAFSKDILDSVKVRDIVEVSVFVPKDQTGGV